MKILLINPPKEEEFSLFVLDDYGTKARSNQTPIGLMYLQSFLRYKHEVEILDMNAKEMKIHDIVAEIFRFKPALIGITCVIAKWITVKKLAETIKTYVSTPIVVGGINPSLYPWETLQCESIDYVVSGFGQQPLRSLAESIENRNNTHNIHKVYTRINFPNKIKGDFLFEDVDLYPMPDRSVLPINDYEMPFFPENPCTSMVTSMGCPFKCKFCACKNFSPVLLRNPENIIAEMKHIESIGIRSILFQDELFTMSISRIKEICSLIISEEINLNWSVRSRANLVHRESLDLMKSSGCFNVHLGIESGTDRILERMGKGITVDLIKRSVNTIKSAGLSVTASFMLGYPDESEEEILQTIAFAKELELNNSQFFITQPEPGTELYSELKSIKNLPDDIYSEFILDPDKINLKNNVASTLFAKEKLDEFLRFAYTQTKNLYDIKKETK